MPSVLADPASTYARVMDAAKSGKVTSMIVSGTPSSTTSGIG